MAASSRRRSCGILALSRPFLVWTAALLTAGRVAPPALEAQARVSFGTRDGGTVYADVYGDAVRAVVLAHGGRFDKESWRDQALALESAGFRVLAFDFRGYGQSTGPGQDDPLSAPLHLDVLAAVRYLRATGAESVSVVGGSMGGTAAADAAAEADSGGIDRLVVLGAGGGRAPERLTLPKLVIVTREDASGSGPRLPGIRANFERMPEPKRIVILEGSAHAQQMFRTGDAERVMDEILAFLSVGPAKRYVRASVEQGRIHIQAADGEEVIVPPETGQTGFDHVLVSPDGHAVGWLALYPNCCTSYPVPLKLVVVAGGVRHTFTGHGAPIWRWQFVSGGREVVFRQETVHGGLSVRYERRDVVSGRLIAGYDPPVDPDHRPREDRQRPDWVVQFDGI